MMIVTKSIRYLLFVSSLALVACVLGSFSEQTNASETFVSPEEQGSRFIARLISLEPGMAAAFIAHLSDCYLPAWTQLLNDRIITTVSVFELSHYDTTMTKPSQDYLVLAELSPQAIPDDLLEAEKVSCRSDRRDIPAFSVLRSALMSCTLNSCYGTPEPVYQDAPSGIDFLVEFIGVEDTPNALKKYQEIVSRYAGPANGILVDRGMLHCFIALENVDILFNASGAVPWNQIHISDDWDTGGDIDWDSVYEELFRTEFSCDQDSVWAELPSTDETRTDYHGRLIPTLCVR